MILGKNISLSEYGWTGCFIPTNLKDLLHSLPTWKHLPILRPPEKHNQRKIYFPWDFFETDTGKQYIPALEVLQKIATGSYGTVYASRRAIYEPTDIDAETKTYHLKQTQSFQDIVSKVNAIQIFPEEDALPSPKREQAYLEEIQAVIYEAALHAVVNKLFEAAKFATAVPRLYEVVAMSSERHPTKPSQISHIYMNMELVDGETLFDFLHSHFGRTPAPSVAENDLLFIDLLIQLCVYLDLLQAHLRFNHRDLKINNILFRKTAASNKKDTIHHAVMGDRVAWEIQRSAVIIDFGFSCIACDAPDQKSLIQAGSWFSQRHDCMKPGRDLALFLYSLETYYPLRGKISDELYEILKSTMVATEGTRPPVQLWNGISPTGIPNSSPAPLSFHDGVYKYLRNTGVQIAGCSPAEMLRSLWRYVCDGGTGAAAKRRSQRQKFESGEGRAVMPVREISDA